MIYKVSRTSDFTLGAVESRIIGEITLDKINSFKFDLSEKRGRGNHNARLKIGPKDSNEAHGLCIPLETPKDPNQYYTFDQMASLKSIQPYAPCKKLLNFGIGFVTRYQKEIEDMLDDDSGTKSNKMQDLSIAFKEYKAKYMDPGSLKYDKDRIKADVNEYVFKQMKK